MVITFFGESCTGKSTVADHVKAELAADLFSGKDYLRLAKNPAEAQALFTKHLLDHQDTADVVVYVVSEKEHLAFLPPKAIRVLFTADIQTIKERFAKRMNGNLPAPVAAMLERKHGAFDSEQRHLSFDTSRPDAEGIARAITEYCRNGVK